jgi:hypothetical protein
MSDGIRLSKMDMADGDGQGVGRIGWRQFRKFQDGPDHPLDLSLFRTAVTHDGLFDLQGTVFVNRHAAIRPGQDRHPPDMTLFDQTPDVLPVEDILDGQRLRRRMAEHLLNSAADGLKARRERGASDGLDLAMQDATETVCVLLHNAIPRHVTARIDAQYPERACPLPDAVINRLSSPCSLRKKIFHLQTQLLHDVIGDVEVGIDVLDVVVVL